jgi:hypothetical protein
MKNTEIEKLLKKYWEAETSLQEETQLSTYFKSDNISSEHLPYRDLFQYFDHAAEVTFVDLDEKVIPFRRNRIRRLQRSVIGIAASLLIMLSAGYFIVNQSSSTQSYYGKTTVITEEEEALEMTRDALAFLSSKLDESSRNITSDIKNMEKVSILK